MENNSILWSKILEKIKGELNSLSFQTWFEETKLYDFSNGVAKILVPYALHKDHLANNYSKLITSSFMEETNESVELEFLIQEDIEEEETKVQNEPKIEDLLYRDLEDSNFESNLNKKYTFDNFIVGNSNKFAATSALAVAEQPGKMYNPLFIYGSSGLGKTHLMHSIGNYIRQNSNKKVLYITCDNFVSDFVEICRKNNGNNNMDAIKQFKNKYRDIDVLMIDDIHNLVGATSAQQEFFNTFNELYNNEKQIIISSDKSPDDIKKLEDRLKTRFNWGLQVNILPPDFKLRMDILNKKIENNEITDKVPEEVKEYIASNCVGDVRKLEGAITRVFAYATIMNGCDITLDIAVEALKNYFVKTIVSKNKMDQVIQIVCDNYNLTSEELLSKKRSNEIAIPRMIAMYICRIYLDENLTKIGIQFGGKNHTTVMHAVDKIKKEIIKDDNLNNQIQKMVNEIK